MQGGWLALSYIKEEFKISEKRSQFWEVLRNTPEASLLTLLHLQKYSTTVSLIEIL